MNRYTLDAISIVPLLLGSLMMLVAGFELVPTKYLIEAGLACLVVFALIEIISLKRKNKS